jgi:isoleucyl-tRNA synthetase
VDLSSFYLDILKDRLYTSAPNSPGRRSAQTAMYEILDAMVKLMAPLLPFTAEEVWKYMPQYEGKAESIHLISLPPVNEAWRNAELAKKWDILLNVRKEVTKALEEARAKKLIGHSLDASVTVSTSAEAYDILKCYADDLRSLFIVSKVSLVQEEPREGAYESADVEGLSVLVAPARGEKCERCWIHDPSVGKDSGHPAVCSRCQNALKEIGA